MYPYLSRALRSIGQKPRMHIQRLATSLLLSISLAACGGGAGGGESAEQEPPHSVPATSQVAYNKDNYMPAGFQVINDSGVIQIDQDYFNYSMVAKGTLAVNGGGANISVSGSVAPVLCFRPTGAAVGIMGFTFNAGGTSVWNLRASVQPNLTASVDWWVFDAERAVSDTGPGLSVYDGSGNVVYNSNTPEMRVAGVASTPAFAGGDGWPPSHNLGYWPGKAVCIGQSKFYFVNSGMDTSPYLAVLEAVQFSGDTLITENIIVGTGPILGPGSVYPVNGTASNFLLADIAGL